MDSDTQPVAFCIVCGGPFLRADGFTVNPPGPGSTFFVCDHDWDAMKGHQAP